MKTYIISLLFSISGSLTRAILTLINIVHCRFSPIDAVFEEFFSWKLATDQIRSIFIGFLAPIIFLFIVRDPRLLKFETGIAIGIAFVSGYISSPSIWRGGEYDRYLLLNIEKRIEDRAEMLADEKKLNLLYNQLKSELAALEGNPYVLAVTNSSKKRNIILYNISKKKILRNLASLKEIPEWSGEERRKGPLDQRIVQDERKSMDRRGNNFGRRDYDVGGY